MYANKKHCLYHKHQKSCIQLYPSIYPKHDHLHQTRSLHQNHTLYNFFHSSFIHSFIHLRLAMPSSLPTVWFITELWLSEFVNFSLHTSGLFDGLRCTDVVLITVVHSKRHSKIFYAISLQGRSILYVELHSGKVQANGRFVSLLCC